MTAMRWHCTLLSVALILAAAGVGAADPSQRTQIVVGSELDYPPYALVTADGQADGFSVDLMKAVCEVMEIDVTFRVGPWSEVRAALENGEIDALPLVSYSDEMAFSSNARTARTSMPSTNLLARRLP